MTRDPGTSHLIAGVWEEARVDDLDPLFVAVAVFVALVGLAIWFGVVAT